MLVPKEHLINLVNITDVSDTDSTRNEVCDHHTFTIILNWIYARGVSCE